MSLLPARLSTPGRAVCLLLSLVLAATASGWRAVVGCAAIIVLAAVIGPGGLVVLRRRRVWLFALLLLAPAAFLLGSDADAAGVAFSWQGLAVGVEMALRAVSMMVAVAAFASAVSVSDLSRLMERMGLRGLGFALGIAVNMLPTIQSTLTTAYQSLMLRGGMRRPLLGLRLLLVTVTANSLRHADDIVGSAEARAFDPQRATAAPFVWAPADAWAAAALLLVIVALRLF